MGSSARDSDGSISHVQFFADTSLIGTVSNAPFSIIWVAGNSGSSVLKAVAVDNLGATTESDPVFVTVISGFPRSPVFEITSPRDKSLFPFPGTFSFTAELVASPSGGTGSVEFFVGTNSVGTVTQSGPLTNTTAPYSLLVTNIAEGEWTLTLRKENTGVPSFAAGSCQTPLIRITKLGMQSPSLTTDSRFASDVVTSFPTNQNIIEASSNLVNWTAIRTNVPMTNSFTFTDPSPATNAPRFYRAVVPSR